MKLSIHHHKLNKVIINVPEYYLDFLLTGDDLLLEYYHLIFVKFRLFSLSVFPRLYLYDFRLSEYQVLTRVFEVIFPNLDCVIVKCLFSLSLSGLEFFCGLLNDF